MGKFPQSSGQTWQGCQGAHVIERPRQLTFEKKPQRAQRPQRGGRFLAKPLCILCVLCGLSPHALSLRGRGTMPGRGRTTTEANREDGVRSAQRQRPLAILMDLCMPDLEGLEAT